MRKLAVIGSSQSNVNFNQHERIVMFFLPGKITRRRGAQLQKAMRVDGVLAARPLDSACPA
jgi:hypothetical protein